MKILVWIVVLYFSDNTTLESTTIFKDDQACKVVASMVEKKQMIKHQIEPSKYKDIAFATCEQRVMEVTVKRIAL